MASMIKRHPRIANNIYAVMVVNLKHIKLSLLLLRCIQTNREIGHMKLCFGNRLLFNDVSDTKQMISNTNENETHLVPFMNLILLKNNISPSTLQI